MQTTGRKFTYNRETSSSKGIKSKSNIVRNDGFFKITTSGGTGSEGIESKNTLTINDGTLILNSYDDCINASKAVNIKGGNIYCYSSNDDGVDSNGTLSVSGGLVIAIGSTSPEDGFDCDQNNFAIIGGTLLGLGGSSSTPTSNSCTQRSVLYKGASLTCSEERRVGIEWRRGGSVRRWLYSLSCI